MTFLGVDVSRYQDKPLPWAAWAGRVNVVSIQVTHGDAPEPLAPAHLANAREAGYSVIGAYHFLMPGGGARQAAAFIAALTPYHTWAMLDIERVGVIAGDVRAFCDYFDAHSTLRLVLYGNEDLERVLGVNNPRYAGYGVLVADYGPAWLTSVPLWPPHVPRVGRKIGHQYAGDNGRLLPYAGPIDLSAWDELPVGASSPIPPLYPGTLYGMHAEQSSQTIPLMQAAKAGGVRYAALLAMENPGLCVDAKRLDPRTLTIARWKNPNDRWEGGQDVASWSAAERLDFVRFSIQLILDRTNDTEYAACDYFCPGLNEWDPPEPDGWREAAKVWGMLLDEASRRSGELASKGRRPIRLALPGMAQGTPEFSEMQAVIATGLTDHMQARGDLLLFHEGAFFDQLIDKGQGDLLPGASTVPPGGGSACGRFNYWYQLGVRVPFVVSEFYDGLRRTSDPAERLARLAWYDGLLSRNPWARGFCAFELTDDPRSGWYATEFTPAYQFYGMLADMQKKKDRSNGAEAMPFITDTDFTALQSANTKAAADVATMAGLLAKYLKHTMSDLTNQTVINLFARGLTLPLLEAALTPEQTVTLYAKDASGLRSSLYTGPAVEDMASLTAAQKQTIYALLAHV